MVVGEDGAIDDVKTEARRCALREDRAAKAMPARDWLAKERETRVLARDLSAPVIDMYRSSMRVSPAWAKRYRDFWRLPEDFEF